MPSTPFRRSNRRIWRAFAVSLLVIAGITVATQTFHKEPEPTAADQTQMVVPGIIIELPANGRLFLCQGTRINWAIAVQTGTAQVITSSLWRIPGPNPGYRNETNPNGCTYLLHGRPNGSIIMGNGHIQFLEANSQHEVNKPVVLTGSFFYTTDPEITLTKLNGVNFLTDQPPAT